MNIKTIELCKDRNVLLTAYLQDVGGEYGFMKRPAILILPGGGYNMCSDREAEPVVFPYAARGYQAFVLRYSTGESGSWPIPLRDYEEAMQWIKEHADEYFINTEHIAVIGFSAGGHLAAFAAVSSSQKPAAAILVYPPVLEEVLNLCKPGLPQPNIFVDEKTCPCFIVAARDDRVVDVRNALHIEEALAEKGVPFESHIYSYGGHGFSTGDESLRLQPAPPRLKRWVPDSIEWLEEQMGSFTRNGFSRKGTTKYKQENRGDSLSIRCTLGHLLKQDESTRSILQPVLIKLEEQAEERSVSIKEICTFLQEYTLEEILGMLGFEDQEIRTMEKNLNELSNK